MHDDDDDVYDVYIWSGTLPNELCELSALTSLVIWSHHEANEHCHDGHHHYHHSAITCTLSCLSTKMSVHHQPPDDLPQCDVDTIDSIALLHEHHDESSSHLRVMSEGERVNADTYTFK